MKDAVSIDLTRYEAQQVEDARFEIPSEEKYLEVLGLIEEALGEFGIDFTDFERRVVSERPSTTPLQNALGVLANEWAQNRYMEWD